MADTPLSSNPRLDALRFEVEQDRRNGVGVEQRYRGDAYSDRAWALAEIDRLTASLAEANTSANRLIAENQTAWNKADELDARARHAEADRDRLRAAEVVRALEAAEDRETINRLRASLERIVQHYYGDKEKRIDMAALDMAHIAREALERPADETTVPRAEPFVVKHYTSESRPIIKGNGFDGLEIGEDREEAQEFVDWLNARLAVNGEVAR